MSNSNTTTVFNSRAYGVSDQNLSDYFGGFVRNVKELEIYHIDINFSGHGHYGISSEFIVDGEKLKVNTSTNNMPLIDAWKSLMSDNYEAGEDGFDDENDIVSTMLSALNADDKIVNFAQDLIFDKEEE